MVIEIKQKNDGQVEICALMNLQKLHSHIDLLKIF